MTSLCNNNLMISRQKETKIERRNRAAAVVLGDFGRSPRMQYHALSLAHREMMLTVATKKLKQGPALKSLENYFIFLSNNYFGLSSHPTVSKAAVKAALVHGMGPRGSALICWCTSYHGLLESCLADLKKKEGTGCTNNGYRLYRFQY
ncbi:uncharacterized protein LOC114258304 isoform X2 [Camellia sinensis]|uniref:uncharacterized protein LOC114258304 isoform X2 n=1 Tax=Camellia sinensis TaxID=4442 RepID=UPI00103687F3|nr:uncharacterized protein LOC114258304 isoform X2 [Camellia sinensis]